MEKRTKTLTRIRNTESKNTQDESENGPGRVRERHPRVGKHDGASPKSQGRFSGTGLSLKKNTLNPYT